MYNQGEMDRLAVEEEEAGWSKGEVEQQNPSDVSLVKAFHQDSCGWSLPVQLLFVLSKERTQKRK